MKISTRGQYALESLLCLAASKEPEPLSIHAIAERTRLSEGYLEQLFIPLKRAGFVVGSRGVQGGYRLAKKPGEISSFDVLSKMETSLRSVPCGQGGTCERKARCKSKKLWESIESSLEGTLKSITLEDLTAIYRGVEGFVG